MVTDSESDDSNDSGGVQKMDEETSSSNKSQQSALEANIASKGKNAYYFAHSHKATGPKWDGKPQPRLLSKNSSLLEDGTTSSSKSKKSSFDDNSTIKNYSFCDETSKIKIYIPLVVSSADDVVLENDCESFTLTATDVNNENKRLSFNKLFSTIEDNGKVIVKSDKIILVLTKKEIKEWPKLGF